MKWGTKRPLSLGAPKGPAWHQCGNGDGGNRFYTGQGGSPGGA